MNFNVRTMTPRNRTAFDPAAAAGRRLKAVVAAAALMSLPLASVARAAEEAPMETAKDPAKAIIPVVRPTAGTPVDFDRQVLPILKANCLACHNRTSSKGDLLLETPADILKGGETGPAAVPGKAAESLALKVATHESKPRMPPRENKVNARDLTPEELGILASWIDQGAKASEKHLEKIDWQPVAAGFNAIYAVAVSGDGIVAACGRANRIDVYHVPSGEHLARLDDPALEHVAHRDVVNSLALNFDGTQLASGGYREVKLWRRPTAVVFGTNGFSAVGKDLIVSDATHRALVLSNGVASLLVAEDRKPVAELKAGRTAGLRVADAGRALAFAKADADFRQSTLDAAVKELQASNERLKKAVEGDVAAQKSAVEKETAAAKPRRARFDAELDVVRAGRDAKPDVIKKAKEKLEAANKALEGPENEVRTARLKASTARNELELSRQALHRAETTILAARQAVREARLAVAAAEAEVAAAKQALAAAVLPVRATALSASGRFAATADSSGMVHLWDGITGAPLDLVQSPGARVEGLAFAGDRHVVLIAGAEQWAWDLNPAWKLERTFGTGGPDSTLVDRVNAVAFRRDGRRLAAGGGEPSRSSELRIWDPVTGADLYSVTNLHSDAVLSVAFSPDGAWLASGGADRFARVIDVGTCKPVRAFEGHTGHVLGVAWAPNGRTLASGGADGVVKFWNFTTGERKKQGGGFGKEVGALAYVANDQLVAVTGDPAVRVLNENADKVRDLEGSKDFQVSGAVSVDGSTIVSGGLDGVLRVWRGTETKPFREFSPVKAPDGPVAGK